MRPPVVVPLISETTKRSFTQSSPAVHDEQHDPTRPVSAVTRSVLSACLSLICPLCYDGVGCNASREGLPAIKQHSVSVLERFPCFKVLVT